jgi:phosphoribosylanthranilate isomerase
LTTKVKICGITNTEDALAAVDAGADAIGMVFYRDSKRYIEPARAQEIVAAVGPFVSTVGLFVNEQVGVVERVLRTTGIQMAQLHGDEGAAYCDQLAVSYIKAIRMAPGVEPHQAMAGFPQAKAFLFDAWQPDQYGGTGTCFDWHRMVNIEDRPAILAGGLTVDNVREAVALTEPYAVDVSGGVEISPGRKDKLLMERFINAAKAT